MSIENDWKQMNGEVDASLTELLKTTSLKSLSSNNPLKKLKKSLLINICLGVAICLLYVWVIVYFRLWQVQISIGVVLIFSVWAVYTAYQQYRQIQESVSSSNSILSELKRNYASIDKWLKVQQRVALCIYPISAAGGFMLGGAIGSNKPIAVFMNHPIVITAFIITLAVLVPACYLLSKWLCKISFGKHLISLRKNIEDLEVEA